MSKQLKTIDELFKDKFYISEIQKKLPKLFRMAEIESSRGGKIGMFVGSIRENVIIALLIYAFGNKAVNPEFTITATEKDLELAGKPISIKTITNSGYVKAVWTVDAASALRWTSTYEPKMDILLAKICWNTKDGGLFLIPVKVQIDSFKKLGRTRYLKMPKLGTNPRGVEFSKEAISSMLSDKRTLRIEIDWVKPDLPVKSIYQRWIDVWKGTGKNLD